MANVRSLNNKLNDIRFFIDSVSPDICVFTETWLDKSTPSSVFACCNTFTVFRKDRSSRGGGVCMLIKQSAEIAVSQVLMPSGYDDLDIVAVDLRDGNDTLPLRLVAVYRPPSMTASDNDRLFSVLNDLAVDCVRLCVLGDFNLPLINWDLFVYPENQLYCTATDFICNHGLSQLVNEPTRGNSILDIILCTDLLCCDSVDILAPIASSDHSVVSFNLYISLPHDTPVFDNKPALPNYSKADWSGLCCYLMTVDWLTEFMSCVSVGEYWDKFMDIILYGIDEFVPKYKRTKHVTGTKWYPRHIRMLLAKKNRCWKVYKHFRTTALYDKYRHVSRQCTKAIDDHVANYEDSLVNDGRLGNFYKYVNKKLNGSNGIAPLRNENGVLVYNDTDKAVLLNDYFTSIFTKDNGLIDVSRLPNKVDAKMPPVFFTPFAVSKCINQLKHNGSAGPDNIPAEFYRTTCNYILVPLSIIFNLSIQTGELPDIWKSASITPVFKKGSPSDPTNYRPISLTCVACKLLESGIKVNLLSHLLQYNVISRHQHGFLSRKSTTTQMLECCCDWQIALNCHYKMDIIYLDFSKAFDSVIHSKLLAKLECYGVDRMLLNWICNLLNNRIQFVKISGKCSPTSYVISGVPQGSVLGPVLFVVYVNDICDVVPTGVTIKLFADDVKLYSVFDGNLTPHCLQSCLTAISDWSDHWQLKLSPTKCSVLHVRRAKMGGDGCVYHIGNVPLPAVDSVTDLGVSYDNNLQFGPHISHIVSKAALRAKLILKCFQSRDPGLLTRAFCTFVRPILEYCSVVWSPMFKRDIYKIEAVQRRFTKRLNGLYNLSYSCRLARLGLDSLYCRRVKYDLIMCYKVLHNMVSIDCNVLFQRSQVSHTRGNSMKLSKHHVSSRRDGHFFANRVINIWNSLPDHIVASPSVACFKRKVSKMNFNE